MCIVIRILFASSYIGALSEYYGVGWEGAPITMRGRGTTHQAGEGCFYDPYLKHRYFGAK